jgi:hypothetical protein
MSRGTVVRLEDLLGACVVAANGRRVGRIEDVCAELRDGDYVVVEYRLGTGALLERWSVVTDFFGAFGIFGFRGRTLIARWNQLDISDPRRPRLTCPLDEIERTSG